MEFGHHLIIDVETGEEKLVPLTAEEIAGRQEILDSLPTDAQIKQAQIEREAKRAALLEKLGISEDEARLLLG